MRLRLGQDLPSRLARMMLAVLMAFAWAGGTTRAQSPGSARATTGPTLTREQATEQVRAAFEEIERAARALPRDSFDPLAVVERVGRDPQKLFEWVRDQTFLVPYRGCLRGPTGVLMDRIGNSLDRALLLAELMRLTGQQVRLARAELTEEQAAEFASKARPVPHDWLSPAPASDASVAQEWAGTDASQAVQQSLARAARLAEDAVQRAEEQSAWLLAQLPPAMPNSAQPSSGVGALRDHWRVQWNRGGQWTDLDPTLPDSTIGAAAPAAVQTVDLPSDGRPVRLDDAMHHQVAIRVVIERWSAGKLEEQPVLIHTLRPAEHYGQRIAISNVPLSWPRELNLLAQADPLEKLKETALAQRKWLPVLQIGAESVSDSGFDDEGTITSKAEISPGAIVGQRVAGAMGGFGAALGGGGDQPQAKAVLTAQWIEFDIRTPGEAPQIIRRSVFDLIGPAARAVASLPAPQLTDQQRVDRALSILGQVELLPQTCWISPHFAEHLMLAGMLEQRKAYESGLALRPSDGPAKEMQAIEQFRPLPSPYLYSLAVTRQAFSRHRADIYLDRLNLLCFDSHLSVDQAGQVIGRDGFDILSNTVALLPAREANAFAVRLYQGVLDTNLEALLLGAQSTGENTGELLSRSLADGAANQWTALLPSGDSAAVVAGIPDDVRARLTQEVQAGSALVLPREPVAHGERSSIGWWRIDPQTGTTLGISGSGKGQSMSEYIAFFVMFLLPGYIAGAAQFAGCIGKSGFKSGVSTGKFWFCAGCGFALMLLVIVGTFALVLSFGTGASVALFAIGVLQGAICNVGGGFMD